MIRLGGGVAFRSCLELGGQRLVMRVKVASQLTISNPGLLPVMLHIGLTTAGFQGRGPFSIILKECQNIQMGID